ncbi:23S rRNA (guanosine(2251)-2'-O)-methyltransferase RlmB [Paenibacillus sp.]|uniref:23S rRNA (guanosine(2251)-2'-O)-methyltransferase RlmB n=1 Tax=Paenibacillus sp. TaxID=58172 RepID=UPI002D5584BD|nr:23S rRNA (guanosine(2251)-2'-O)-methyltransferase RlmB [Paenibacillus sp.]HZG55495.1 23S rRNA (guanosine(2251)-2'-O)-methyltransferase RlmB [Paenibacillus sp.]
MSEEVVAGRHPVLEAIRSGRTIHKVMFADAVQGIGPVLAEARAKGVVTQQVDKRKLDQAAVGVRHQGIVALVAERDYAEIDDLFAAAEASGEPPLFVLLDEIEDPHNLGSILRTVDCAGAHGVIVPKRRSAGLTATVAKTSAGAIEHVPVARVTNMAQTIDELKERGVWIAGADGSAERDVYAQDLKMPLAFVIGNEGHGLGRLVRERCDFLVKVPMFGRINSLNASVAASLLLYEAVRQRRVAGSPAAGRRTNG